MITWLRRQFLFSLWCFRPSPRLRIYFHYLEKASTKGPRIYQECMLDHCWQECSADERAYLKWLGRAEVTA